jgi:hypothetical protein
MGKIISFDDFSKRAKKLSEEDLILPIAMGHSKPSNGHEKVDGDHQYYMFFQNLVSIKHYIDEILENNPDDIDACLKNGHDWAADHIATSKDDIQEVAEWLMAELHGDDMDQDGEEDDEEEDDEEEDDEEGEDEEGEDEEEDDEDDSEEEGSDDEEDDDYEEEEEVEEGGMADLYDFRKRDIFASKKSGGSGEEEEGEDDEEGEVIDESDDFEIDEDEEWEESEDFNDEDQEIGSDEEEIYTEEEYEGNENQLEEDSNDEK